MFQTACRPLANLAMILGVVSLVIMVAQLQAQSASPARSAPPPRNPPVIKQQPQIYSGYLTGNGNSLYWNRNSFNGGSPGYGQYANGYSGPYPSYNNFNNPFGVPQNGFNNPMNPAGWNGWNNANPRGPFGPNTGVAPKGFAFCGGIGL